METEQKYEPRKPNQKDAHIEASFWRGLFENFSCYPKTDTHDDFPLFVNKYFTHFTSEHKSVLHEWIYKNLPEMRKGTHLAIAAPRGEAKSTLITQLYVLWLIVTGREKYVVIVMATHTQSCSMLKTIKDELAHNVLLAADYPSQTGEGPLWREGVIITKNNAKIEGFGAGQKMRGVRHGEHRPGIVIADDLENDDNVRSRVQRDKIKSWFRGAVLKLGPPDGRMSVIIVGTVLHHDSLLASTLDNPAWQSARFQAIIKWPDRRDLWDEWERIYLSYGESTSDEYYESNRVAMDSGVVVSWPGVRPILNLMKIRARDGLKSFDSEMQNSPSSDNSMFSNIRYWSGEISHDWLIFGAVDPSMGRSRTSDPSAIIVGGYDRKSGVLYIIDALISRIHPNVIIDKVIGFQRLYNPRTWAIEAVQFQQYFSDNLVERSAAAGVPVPAKEVKPHSDKILRISSMQPHTDNGLILFRNEQVTLVEQFQRFGEAGSHDDGPDAVHMLWNLAQEEAGRLQKILISQTSRRSNSNNLRGFM